MMDMKPSGVQWLGDIPAEWKLGKVKNTFFSTKTIVGDKVDDYERLALTLNGVIKRSKEANDGIQPEKFDGYQILKENELVFKLIDLSNVTTSRVGLSPYTGIVSPAYIVLHDRRNGCPRYAEYYFLSMWMHEVFNHLGGDGVRSSLNAKELLNVPFPLISESEQQAIADYLDDNCSKIDVIIAESTASIEEYKELKKVIITEMVTGINISSERIESHYGYLGTYPENWNIIPISQLFTFVGGYAYKSDRFIHESDYQVIRMGNVKNDALLLDANPVYISEEEALISNKARLKENDMLFTMTGTKGKGDYLFTLLLRPEHLQEKELYLNQRVGCFRKRYKNVFMPYYNYLLKSEKVREYIFLFETGTANQGNIGIESLNRIRLYNPPYNEQVDIVKFLDEHISQIDALISEKQTLIDDLQAYKKSLIYEVVTGKRRVV